MSAALLAPADPTVGGGLICAAPPAVVFIDELDALAEAGADVHWRAMKAKKREEAKAGRTLKDVHPSPEIRNWKIGHVLFWGCIGCIRAV